jgi:hypothetical protein
MTTIARAVPIGLGNGLPTAHRNAVRLQTFSRVLRHTASPSAGEFSDPIRPSDVVSKLLIEDGQGHHASPLHVACAMTLFF